MTLLARSAIPVLLFALFAPNAGVRAAAPDATAVEHFEKRVRPLLVEQCLKCHGADKARGGLRVDSEAALRRGGDSGPVVVPGKPDESLLLRAVRQTGTPKMPPESKLSDRQIADLATWIQAGALWPRDVASISTGPLPAPVKLLAPNASELRPHLQAWFRADVVELADGEPLVLWPDQSGRGRDLAPTRGVRTGGLGAAPKFMQRSTIMGRPAARFDTSSGIATSPDNPLDIKGNAALTLVLVMNLQANDSPHAYDGILGLGNPAAPGNPGKPLAALVQINREPGGHSLRLAGGWNHDAWVTGDSARALYDRPVILTIVKQPGPMRTSTSFHLNGERQKSVTGVETVPDIQHRRDIGLYLGKSLSWAGSIRGDVAEILVFNKALIDAEREGLEGHLADRYGLILPAQGQNTETTFTPEQRGFWAFQPVRDSAVPAVKNTAWVRSPLDAFVLAKLEAKGLQPAPPADRVTLLRRVTFDLTGLPPTPEEIESFVKDQSPDAFAKVVDRLLASPHYGERWGRHWLDVVRYAETTANDANAVMRYAWRYRDYVVEAFNRDLPYDQFLVEQLAGDLLPATSDRALTVRRIIATGFLMLGPKALAETDKEQARLDIVDEQIDVTSRAFLGLTVSCARCHDHKFDPIPTADYYALAGIFRGTEPFRDDVANASMWQEWPLPVGPGETPLVVMAPREGKPTNLRIHQRGNLFTLGPVVPRRFPQILTPRDKQPAFGSQSGRLELARWISSKDNPLTARVMVNRLWQHHFGTGLVATSDNFGARGELPSHSELLDWLASRFVERGWSIKAMHRLLLLSSTYQMSSRPDERALQVDPGNRLLWRMPRRRLDAESLRDSLLAISGRLDRTLKGDEASEFLYREGEVIDKKRDFFRPNQVKADHPFYTQSRRRSLYLPVVRNALPDVLALFDASDPNAVTAVRNDTTVASQALFLLNHPFVREQALAFSRRLLDAKLSDAERLALGYRLALGREPRDNERGDAAEFLKKYQSQAIAKGRTEAQAQTAAWQSLCQTLLCRNEFLYVD
jgi:mono/diheme cytochrome c family protein